MKEKNKRMKEMTKLTFENVPETTYWRNPNSGVIYHCSVHRNTWVECDEFEDGGYDYDTDKNHMNISSINTRVEYNYYYSWDEIVEKFEFLCTSDGVDEDYYVNILANKRLYFFCLNFYWYKWLNQIINISYYLSFAVYMHIYFPFISSNNN